MGASLIGSDIQDGILREIADDTQMVLCPPWNIRADRTAAVIPATAGIHVPTLWASAFAGATTNDRPSRGPYIGKESKLNYAVESTSYNFMAGAKLNILLKTKGLIKN